MLVRVYALFRRTRATSLMFELYAYQATPQEEFIAQGMESEEQMLEPVLAGRENCPGGSLDPLTQSTKNYESQ